MSTFRKNQGRVRGEPFPTKQTVFSLPDPGPAAPRVRSTGRRAGWRAVPAGSLGPRRHGESARGHPAWLITQGPDGKAKGSLLASTRGGVATGGSLPLPFRADSPLGKGAAVRRRAPWAKGLEEAPPWSLESAAASAPPRPLRETQSLPLRRRKPAEQDVTDIDAKVTPFPKPKI